MTTLTTNARIKSMAKEFWADHRHRADLLSPTMRRALLDQQILLLIIRQVGATVSTDDIAALRTGLVDYIHEHFCRDWFWRRW